MRIVAKAVGATALVLALGSSSPSFAALYLKCMPAEKIQWDAIQPDPPGLPNPHRVTLGASWEKPVHYKIQIDRESLAWSSDFGTRSLQPLIPCVPEGCKRNSDFYYFVDAPGTSGMEDRISINRKTGAWDALQTDRIEIKGRCAATRPPRHRQLKNRF